jgi:hypothetical protein
MVTYHYVQFYVSIIIQLEVININVRNFKFPIGFYSNPHPLWVVFVCETVNPAQIFNQIPCPLEQPVLLSLIQQLSADIGNNTELKHKYVLFIHTQPYWTQTQSLPNRPLTLSTHISNFDDIRQCWIFTPHFYAVFWQPFWKWQTSWKFWKCRIAPLMVT